MLRRSTTMRRHDRHVMRDTSRRASCSDREDAVAEFEEQHQELSRTYGLLYHDVLGMTLH